MDCPDRCWPTYSLPPETLAGYRCPSIVPRGDCLPLTEFQPLVLTAPSQECERKIRSFLQDYKLACSPTHPTLFERILSPEAKVTTRTSSVVELRNDAYTFLVGGTDTTAWAITLAIWHVARNPEIHARLLAELRTVMPNPEDEVDSNTLEKLPLLV